MYQHSKNFVGDFTDNDGTIDFYLRVNSIINERATVLDIGAGRAAWFEDDDCKTRRDIRLLKGKVETIIAADVDEAVLSNRASDRQIVMKDGVIDLPANSVDVVIADYVLEHIDDPTYFVKQVNHVLRSGGWFCARTPHKFNYVSLGASLVKNASHASWLKKLQPDRKEIDVFPTAYKMNTLRDIRNAFQEWEDLSFVFRTDPAYYFGSKTVYHLQALAHRVLPAPICGNIFAFLRKP